MDPIRLSDPFLDRLSITAHEVERGHQMNFDESLRSSLGPVGDPMFVSTERKSKKDIDDSLASSQISLVSGQTMSSLGILHPDAMADLSASFSQLDNSLNQPSFASSIAYDEDRDYHVNGQASDFKPGERGKATGVESIGSSEIDTEDELDAVRRENAMRAYYQRSPADVHAHHPGDGGESSDSDDHAQRSRPRLEGGSSDEQDATLPSSPLHEMTLRQSAEGEVMSSPVPGDGGGGGDGMSDGETTTAPSVVNGGHRRMAFRSRSSQSGYSDQERNVEGLLFSDSQPTPDPSRLSPHFLLPTGAPYPTGPSPSSPELRPFSSASSLHFEESVRQQFWESGMLEREEDRRGNGMENEDMDQDSTLVSALGNRVPMSLEEFEDNEANINTEQDILEINQMMNAFVQDGAASQAPREFYNPFDSMDVDQDADPPPQRFATFDGGFMAQGDAQALLDQDQKEFEEENKFRPDEQITSDHFSDHNVSVWTTASNSHMTLERSEGTDERFDRHASLGEFMRTRTEALGSLTGEGLHKRPSFGTGHIKTPEARQPVALMETSRLSQVSEEQEGTADRMQGMLGMEDLGESIRFSGVGSDTEDKRGRSSVQSNSTLQWKSHLDKDSKSSFPGIGESTTSRDSTPMASMYFRAADPEGSAASNSQPRPNSLFRKQSDDSKMASLVFGDLCLADDTDNDFRNNSRATFPESRTLVGETPDLSMDSSTVAPDPNDQTMPLTTPMPKQVLQLREENEPDGTKTPPIATSSIAAAIVNASSCTRPEEFAAMIVALSNKNRKAQSSQGPKSLPTESLQEPKQFSNYQSKVSANQEQKFNRAQRRGESGNVENQRPQSTHFSQTEREASRSKNGSSEAKSPSTTLSERTQPSGTDSEPSLRPKKHPASSGSTSNSKSQQDEKSFKSSAQKSRMSPNISEQAVKRETPKGSLAKGYAAVSPKEPSSSGIPRDPSNRITSEKEVLENSTLNELARLELSYDSRMRVHTRRIKSIQRAQEYLDIGRQGVRDSIDTVDNDSYLISPSPMRTSPQRVKKPEVDQELAKMSSDEEMMEETFADLDTTLSSTIIAKKSQPLNLPSKRDLSNVQEKQKDLSKMKSTDGSQVTSRGREYKHKVSKNTAKDDFSSDDENDDLPLRHPSRNDPLSNGQPRLKTSKHKPEKFQKFQRAGSTYSETKRNVQNTDTFKGKNNLSDKNQWESDLNSQSTTKDDRSSLSPGLTPNTSNTSSLRSTNSSLSECATQTSDDDSAVKASKTSSSQPPPVTTLPNFPNRPYVSTPPTLLTTQSLLTSALLNQYLNEQAVTSKPPNMPSVVTSCTSCQTSLNPAQMHFSHQAPQSSHFGVTQTLPPLSVNTGQFIPTINPLQSFDPSTARDLGPLLDRVPIPGQADSQLYPTSATMPVLPLQSTYSLPASVHGLCSLSASNPTYQAPSVTGYSVSSLPSRPVSSPDYGPPHPLRITTQGVNPVLVGSINIKGVCCLGIAKQTQLPLRNPGPRWLQCHMEVVSVSLNGEELPPGSLSSFLIKPRTTISPQSTEEVKVAFMPHQPGIYVAQIQVCCSPVVAGGEVAYLSQGVPVTVLARAEKPSIEIRGAQNETLDLGVLSYGKVRSTPLHLANKGASSVPLRLLIRTNSAAWHSFYIVTGDTKTNPDQGLNLPTHITLDGPNDTATLWVHIRASEQEKALSPRSLSAPEQVSAKLEVSLDVPEGGVPITSVTLRATVGQAKLNIPREYSNGLTLKSTGGEHTAHMVALRNVGNIPLDLELNIQSEHQDVFSVIPQAILLAPNNFIDVMVKYAPQEVPSNATGELQMCARPDGPFYKLQLLGETKEKTVFLVNKSYLSWGGVPVGRALKQHIIIRACSKTEDLRLQLSIKADNCAFQLLNTFQTGDWSTDYSQFVTLKPNEDFPVHILFSPGVVGTYQAKLNIKPPGWSQKYPIPLSGYGGVSKLVVHKLTEATQGCYNIDMGEVSSRQSPGCLVTISNVGQRSAFVKALGFQDEQCKTKLLSTELQVEPSEFILDVGRSQALTVTLHPNKLDETWAKRASREGFLAGVGLFYGDEISRKQFRKALVHRDSEELSLSEDNPLRGIAFDWPIPGEAKVQEVCNLPCQSGDVNLFYRCLSRVMLHLRGQLQLANPTSQTTAPVVPLSPVRTAGSTAGGESRAEGTGLPNRPVTVPFTPPVKGTPGPRTQQAPTKQPQKRPPAVPSVAPTAPLHDSPASSSSTPSWSVLPQRLVLTTPGTGGGVQKRHGIQISNHSVRQLRFETMHTPDCLIVTPAAGVVEPSKQYSVLVSCNPSIKARGVQLPWSGAILVVCDGQQQEVKIQIREDFGMDTSVIPSLGQMQSLPDQPATPDTPETPARIVVPRFCSPVKLQTKMVQFPDTKVGSTTKTIVEFKNRTIGSRQWYLSSFAPAYVKQANGDIFRATYSAFRFAYQSGFLGPEETVKLHLEFIPRDEGEYSQYWDFESSDKSKIPNITSKSRMEIKGQGILGNGRSPPHRPTKKPRGSADDTLVRIELRHNPRLTKAAQLLSVDNTSEGEVSQDDANAQDKPINTLPDSTTAGGISLVNDHLVFDTTKVGSMSMLKVEVQNKHKQMHTVKFLSPQPPFFIRHHEHTVRPKRYIRLPVTYRPTAPGKHQGVLMVQTEGQHNLMARLEGVAV